MSDYRGTSAYDLSLFEPRAVTTKKSSAARASSAQSASSRTSTARTSTARTSAARTVKNNAPQRSVKPAPARTPKKPDTTVKKATVIVDAFQTEIERESKYTAIPANVKKAIVFCSLCFVMVLGLLFMRAQNDKLDSQISTVKSQIAIANGENVRLNAELSSKLSSDKTEKYATDVLGMVKAESYQITYIDLSDGDEIVVSGDKAVDTDSFGAKLKDLFAYIF